MNPAYSKYLLAADLILLNRHNPAFVTDFRIYPETKYDDHGELLFEKELRDKTDREFTETINEYNRKVAKQMIDDAGSEGTSIVSYTDSYKTTEKKRVIVAIKSYPMSPFTDKENMDILLEDLYRSKGIVDRRA